jgi:hypothetical protein
VPLGSVSWTSPATVSKLGSVDVERPSNLHWCPRVFRGCKYRTERTATWGAWINNLPARHPHIGDLDVMVEGESSCGRVPTARCSSSCAASLSPYLPIGSSQLTCWRSPATAAPLWALRPTRCQHRHQRLHRCHLQLPRLRAPADTCVSPHASPRKGLRGGGGVCCGGLAHKTTLLLHATLYVFTQFAECTGTDCKSNGITIFFFFFFFFFFKF